MTLSSQQPNLVSAQGVSHPAESGPVAKNENMNEIFCQYFVTTLFYLPAVISSGQQPNSVVAQLMPDSVVGTTSPEPISPEPPRKL